MLSDAQLKSFLTDFLYFLFCPFLPLVFLTDGFTESGDDFVACTVFECC
jgi:hypothetical protein